MISGEMKAQDIFFPLAALHAAVFAPLSVLAMTTGTDWLSGLAGAGHAFEMFFGFALALLAGYLLGPVSKTGAILLVALWLGGRLAVLLSTGSQLIALLTITYSLVLAWKVVPRFRHARKWRNRAVTWILSTIFLMPLAWVTLEHGIGVDARKLVPVAPLLLFALLMAFMGGRIIAPAAAGEIQRCGQTLEARVQPRLEGSIVILGGLAITSLFLAVPSVTSTLVLALAAVILVRLLRWRLWLCWRRPDIIAMGIGYAWLSAGILATGLAMAGMASLTAAIHLITVGALGTLSTSVMLQQLYRRKLKQKPGPVLVLAVTALIALASLARWFSATGAVERETGLWGAAVAWSVAYVAVTVQLLWHGKPATVSPAGSE